MVYMYEEKNSQSLIELNNINSEEILKTNIEEISNITSKEILEKMDNKSEKETLEKIKTKIEYEYENKLSTTIPTKSSVTNMKGEKIEITFEKPKFLQEDKEEKITSSKKGTLIHLCMQKLNPKQDYDLENVKKLIDELAFKEVITAKEKEAINPYKILEFTKSEVWKQLKTAKEYYQEKPFYINIPAKEVYEEDIEENILVQGIIDLYYIDKNDNLILLDYKTDYVEAGQDIELVNKYKKQLEIYKKALESALHRKVGKIYIYSVYLGKEIEI